MIKSVAFRDKKTGKIIITKEYSTQDEYFEIMDNINPNYWEITFEKINK